MSLSLKRMLTMPVLAVALSTSLLAVGATPAQAEPAPVVAPVVVQQVVPSTDTLNAEDWRTLKQNLNKSSATRAVEVAGGTRTLTYTMESGSTLVLEEPAGPTSDVTTQVSAGRCGWYALCVYFTPTEQRMILAGYGALIVAGICAVTGPAGCAVAGFVVAVAAAYINDQVCSYRLRVRVLPTVGGARCV